MSWLNFNPVLAIEKRINKTYFRKNCLNFQERSIPTRWLWNRGTIVNCAVTFYLLFFYPLQALPLLGMGAAKLFEGSRIFPEIFFHWFWSMVALEKSLFEEAASLNCSRSEGCWAHQSLMRAWFALAGEAQCTTEALEAKCMIYPEKKWEFSPRTGREAPRYFK